MKSHEKSRARIGVLAFIVFLDLLGFGIIIPSLPFYAMNFGAAGMGVGLLMMAYSLAQFIGAPIWGRLSDRHGRRPILLIGVLGTAIGMAILGWADSFAWLIVGRVVSGFSGANISIAYAFVTDITDEKERPKAMGILGASLGLGFTLGPALGALLSPISYSAPMFVAAGLGVCNFLIALKVLPESNPDRNQRSKPGTPWQILKLRESGSAAILFFLFTFALTQLEVVFALFMNRKFDFDSSDVGATMAGIGFLMILTQGGLVGPLTKKFRLKSIILSAFLASGVAFFLYAWTESLTFSLLVLSALSISRGFLQPGLSTLASLGISKDLRGVAMGTFHSGGAAARVLGPPLAGYLYDHASPSTPFVVGGVLLMAAFGIVLFRLRASEF